MLSPGQEAQNIHGYPSKSCPCLSNNPTGPSCASFCCITCTLGPSRPRPVCPPLRWVLPPGLYSCQTLSRHPAGASLNADCFQPDVEPACLRKPSEQSLVLSSVWGLKWLGMECLPAGVCHSLATPTPIADPRPGPRSDLTLKCSHLQLRTHCVLASETRACPVH